jgi:hypothetical protein
MLIYWRVKDGKRMITTGESPNRGPTKRGGRVFHQGTRAGWSVDVHQCFLAMHPRYENMG